MKIKITFFTVFLISSKVSFGQISLDTIQKQLTNEITYADTAEKQLLSKTAFNILMQRRTINYLTGVSDLSLVKTYASYTSESDKFNLGFNVSARNAYTKRLAFVFNPIVEADVKSNFATFYKDGKWVNNIRGGLKVTYLLPNSTLNFYKNDKLSRRQDLRIIRTRKYNEVMGKLSKEKAENNTLVKLVSGKEETATGLEPTEKEWKKIRDEAFEEMGKAEADYVDKKGAYAWLSTGWFSVWGFMPLSNTEQFITQNISQPFTKTEFNLWEVNVQFSYILDHSKLGTLYLSTWLKRFQNNSANANLMQNVDYGQYAQLPGSNPLNLALIENRKAFIGDYSEFMTTNFNIQVVYIAPWRNTLIKPGLSFRYERNWGQFSPINLRFGLPINIQGKDKPVNIELQYRINDISNYRNIIDHEPSRSFGVSLGFPVVLLYK